MTEPSPEPWKVALLDAVCDISENWATATYRPRVLALIEKHAPATPDRSEGLRRALGHALHRNHEVSDGCSGCAEGKALEVKP